MGAGRGGDGGGGDEGGGDGGRRRKMGGGIGDGGVLEWVTEVVVEVVVGWSGRGSRRKRGGNFFLCVLGILRCVGKKLCEIFWGSCSKSCYKTCMKQTC